MKALEDFRYYLLSAKNPPSEYTDIHNKAFRLWMNGWKEVFKDLKYDDSLLHDDFIRQDLVSCISFQDEVIGVLLYTFFSLEAQAVRSFRYMEGNYPEIFFANLKKMNVKTAMAMQFMFVHPEWRGKDKAIHPGLAFAGLSSRVRDEYNFDAAIAPMRRDFKVNELYYSFGADCIVANVVNHNAPCDLVASVRGKTRSHPSEEIRRIEDFLWDTRVDALKSTELQKIAA
jgi:hypothetical protein